MSLKEMAGTHILKIKLFVVAVATLVLSYQGLCFAIGSFPNAPTWQRLCAGIMGVFGLFFGLISLWMVTMRISYGHTLLTAYMHFIMVVVIRLLSPQQQRAYNTILQNPRITQEDYLKEILKINASTAYVRDFGLGDVTSLNELREKHTLTDYERYRPYIDRMAKGEQGVLTRDPPVRFALTSGTTGSAKMLPSLEVYHKKMRKWLMPVLFNVYNTAFTKGCMLQRKLTLYTAPKLRYTEGGILMGPASLITKQEKRYLVSLSTPPDGFDIADPYESNYVHMLFGLRDPNLRGFTAIFTSNFLSTMRQVEECWPNLVRDIEEGSVTTTKVSPKIHRALVKAMGGGDLQRAAELRREFEKGFDGILKRIWPHLEFAQAIDTSGIKETLLKSYLKGVPLSGNLLGATEGYLGVNLWPTAEGKDEFVLFPQLCVFEFIPEDKLLEDQPDTLFIDELQVGGVYEIVVTQVIGIYRYRLGDVIRVTRYHYETPVVEFMYRAGQILNVYAEKLDQRTVHSAMEAAVGRWPTVKLRDYAVAESTLQSNASLGADHRPFYIIFIELDQISQELSLNTKLLDTVDEELCRHSFTYNSFREKGSIAPPSVHIVKSGAFDRLHDFILDNSTTTANQYKGTEKTTH